MSAPKPEIIETSFEWELPRNPEKEVRNEEWDGDASGKTFFELLPAYVCIVLAAAGFIFGAVHRLFFS